MDSKGKESYVYVADINKYSSSDLSNLKLFVSMACCNGKGGSSAKNIVNSIYSKGAKTSIGCTTTTYIPQAGDWLTHFSMAMGISGKTVSEAMSIADSFVLMLNSSPGGTNNRLVRGSVNYSLKIK